MLIRSLIAVGLAVMTSHASAADPGPKPGDKAVAFELKDQNDKKVTLAELLKKGPVALVFYRSAVW